MSTPYADDRLKEQGLGSLASQPPGGGHRVSDDTTNRHPVPTEPTTVAEVIAELEPMGALSRFVIDDLTPEEENEFFRILEDA